MWNRTDAWSKSYGSKNDLVDNKRSLAYYIEWCERTFGSGDLFVTLNCPQIIDLSTFVFSKTSAIEKRVRKVTPNFSLYRIAVLVKKPQLHAHLIMRSTTFSNDHYDSFDELVYKQFSRALPNERDVSLQRIDNICAVTRYELLMQNCCQIDTRSLYLPPHTSY